MHEKLYTVNALLSHYCYFAVRLVNGSTKYEGRVEVYYNGEWSTVCDNGWDLNDAQVVCKELGFGNAVGAPHRAFYGQGRGSIWLDNLQCIGTEWTIRNCSHSGWGRQYCGHYKDASAKCLSGNIFRVVRLCEIKKLIINNAIRWFHRLCSAPQWIYRVGLL